MFSGCFQRTESTQDLYLKVLDYLRLHRGSTWDRFLTPTSSSSLVHLLIETTEEFLLSKITLLSRVISLYANADSPVARSIHDVSHLSPHFYIGRNRGEEKKQRKELIKVYRLLCL